MKIDAQELFHNPDRSRKAILTKPFLRAIYSDWYEMILRRLPAGPGRIIELGSGAGISREHIPGIVISDIVKSPLVDIVLDATRLPFADHSVRAIIIVNALHHFPDVRSFFREAQRCLAPRGSITMIEPWVSAWSRWVYRHLHYEPFDADAAGWELPSATDANNALPWIIFNRDRSRFEEEFPGFVVAEMKPIMPLRHLASGGVARPWSLPGWSTGLVRRLESLLDPWINHCGLFALLQIRKR
jgi:SAM-dependent methyltransferase